jgi:hypothetical protein
LRLSAKELLRNKKDFHLQNKEEANETIMEIGAEPS